MCAVTAEFLSKSKISQGTGSSTALCSSPILQLKSQVRLCLFNLYNSKKVQRQEKFKLQRHSQSDNVVSRASQAKFKCSRMVPQGTDQYFPGTKSRAGTGQSRIKNPAKPLPKLISNKIVNECKKL